MTTAVMKPSSTEFMQAWRRQLGQRTGLPNASARSLRLSATGCVAL